MKILTLLAAFLAATVNLTAADKIQVDYDPMLTINITIDKIKAESSVASRTDHARNVAILIKNANICQAVPKLVSDLAALMQDRDDSVRYWIAIALSYLGPLAKDAIPALERALQDKKDDMSSKSSASGIQLALERIKAAKHPKNSEH